MNRRFSPPRKSGKLCIKTARHRRSFYPYYDYYQGPEQIARNRRADQFEAVTGLHPIDDESPRAKPLAFLYRQDFSDHCSTWESETGELFVLIEPYGEPTDEELEKVARQRVLLIEVPVDLAPYGGCWSTAPGALPQSRSYLLTWSRNQHLLEEIARKLAGAAKTCPPWNSLDGGEHV